MRRRQNDPTHTKTLRVQYGRDLRRLWLGFMDEVMDGWKEAQESRGLSSPRQLRTAKDSVKFNLEVMGLKVTQAKERFKQKAKDVAEKRATTAYKKGKKEKEGHNTVRYGETDRRAMGSIKTRNLTALNKMSEEMSSQIMWAASDGMERGLGAHAIADRMKDVKGLGIARARLIARTETIRAYNDGASVRLMELGFPGWKWNAAATERTCPYCMRLDGLVFDFDDHSSPRPPLHPNCRCSIDGTTVDAKGRDWDSVEEVVAKKKKQIKRAKKAAKQTQKTSAKVAASQEATEEEIEDELQIEKRKVEIEVEEQNTKNSKFFNPKVINLEDKVLDSKDYRDFMHNNGIEPYWDNKDRLKLTPAQRNSIDFYTGAGYQDFNNYLKNGKYGTETKYDQIADNLDEVFAKNELPQDVVVYRGVYSHVGKKLDNYGSLKENKYLSTTGDPNTATQPYFAQGNEKHVIVMNLEKGTHAIPLGTSEEEIMLPRNTYLKQVDRVEIDGAKVVDKWGDTRNQDKKVVLHICDVKTEI